MTEIAGLEASAIVSQERAEGLALFGGGLRHQRTSITLRANGEHTDDTDVGVLSIGSQARGYSEIGWQGGTLQAL